MSTRCKTHQAEPSCCTEEKPGGLDRTRSTDFQRLGGQFPPLFWLSGLFYLRRTGPSRPSLLQSTSEQLSSPALRMAFATSRTICSLVLPAGQTKTARFTRRKPGPISNRLRKKALAGEEPVPG